MAFVQLIDCKTTDYEELNRLMDAWVAATEGKRTMTHSVIGKNRARAGHYVEIVEFPSYEDAMKNSGLPETNRVFHGMITICDEMPTFTDLDVVHDEHLYKSVVRHFFLEVCGREDPAPFHDLFVANYRDHDVGSDSDALGVDAKHQQTLEFRRAFPDFAFTVEDQIAEGNRVTTRWTWSGTNTGELRGIPATGRRVEAMPGTTIFEFGPEGKITEGWWTWDTLGMMRQLGLIRMPA